MGYIYLAIAIVFELVGTATLKLSGGFTKFWPSLLSVISYVLCYYTFSKCLRRIDLCIAYSTWSAVGIIASAVMGVFLFSEPLQKQGYLGILFLVIGVILINR